MFKLSINPIINVLQNTRSCFPKKIFKLYSFIFEYITTIINLYITTWTYFSRDRAQGPEVCSRNGWSNLLWKQSQRKDIIGTRGCHQLIIRSSNNGIMILSSTSSSSLSPSFPPLHTYAFRTFSTCSQLDLICKWKYISITRSIKFNLIYIVITLGELDCRYMPSLLYPYNRDRWYIIQMQNNSGFLQAGREESTLLCQNIAWGWFLLSTLSIQLFTTSQNV